MIDGSNKGGTKPKETELEALKRSTSAILNLIASDNARLERENALLARSLDALRAQRGPEAVKLHQTATGRPQRIVISEPEVNAVREAWTWIIGLSLGGATAVVLVLFMFN